MKKKLTLFSLAWPIFIEVTLFMLLGFVDVMVLSRYNELAASAVSTANQVAGIFTILFTVISGASAVLISQMLGAKQREQASRIAAISIIFNIVFGIIISIVITVFSKELLLFIGADEAILDFASQYLQIVGSFLFVQAVLNSCSVIIRNHGKTIVSMVVTIIMNVINITFNIILVFGLIGFPELGIQGVAISTSLSRVVGVIILLIVLFKSVEKLSIFKLLKPFPVKQIKSLFKIGVPSAMESFNYNLSQLVVTSIILYNLSDNDLVAKTFVSSIAMFFYLFTVSVGQASQILVGHKVGAGEFDDAYKQGLKAFKIALIISITTSAIGILFRYSLMSIFTDDPAIIAIGAGLLMINIFVEMGRTSNIIIISSLRGAGDVVFPTIVAIFSMWGISTFGSYFLAITLNMGISGMWIAFALDECIRGVLMLWRWKKGKWRTKRLV